MLVPKKNAFLFLLWILLLALPACSGMGYPQITPTPQGVVTVSSDLRDLYQTLGGEAELGPAISIPFQNNGILCQYTTTVLMCFNPSARSESERLYLVPIGTKIPPPANAKRLPSTNIFTGFNEAYNNKFHGERFVGKPLTNVLFVEEKNRIEQYFEKMGFYIELNDPQKTVHLLSYGSYICREACANVHNPGGAINGKGIEVNGSGSLIRIGGFRIFGSPVTVPYRASDGNYEQILENVVLYVPADNPNTLKLRPLGLALSLTYSEPGPQKYGPKENMIFLRTKGEMGYHIPNIFDRFIASHGGMEISGMPLADPMDAYIGNQYVARQCFENYCLDFHPELSGDDQVQLAPLGRQYLKAQKRENEEIFVPTSKTIELIVAEKKPQISNQEKQTIQILVRTRKNQQPVSDMESFVTLALPDGKKVSYTLPSTNLSGMAQVEIEPLKGVGNGVIIPYIVCLNITLPDQVCETDSFLVWNHR